MQITDRSKDVIKSGGEWISSIELENAAVGCPGVAEAAAIGIAHPKWDERPLLVVVRREGSAVTPETIRAHLATEVAKWWLPDAIEFVDELPHTATGKLSKKMLRERFVDYRFEGAAEMVGR
jgi:acyl-CoA synthetase (AMP-forming)/AMP-acid ligase II